MEQLLSRLSSLSYELLGIILPGLFTLILIVLWLVGAGELVPFVSHGFFPRITLSITSKSLESIGVRTGVGILGPILLITYFIGHLLNWMSRGGKQDDAKVRGNFTRTWCALTFRTAKFTHSFDPKLNPLFQAVLPRFSLPQGSGWREFYPVAKNYLIRTSPISLVTLYQNKYTLHRSIVAGAALIFWLSLGAMLFGLYTEYIAVAEPRWTALSFLLAGCCILAWGFSDSYAYNWQMFGNTIVTETFSLLNSPDLAQPRISTPTPTVPLAPFSSNTSSTPAPVTSAPGAAPGVPIHGSP